MKIFQVLIIFLILGCQGFEKERIIDTPELIEKEHTPLDIRRWRKEVLEIDSLKIDGAFSFITIKDSIVAKLGEPKSVRNINNRNLLYPDLKKAKGEAVEWLYGQTIVTGVGNIFVFSVIEFNSTAIKVVSPRIILEKGTSAIEVCKLFPESCKLIMPSGLVWSGHIELKASKKYGDRWRWYLWFRQNKLERMYLRRW